MIKQDGAKELELLRLEQVRFRNTSFSE